MNPTDHNDPNPPQSETPIPPLSADYWRLEYARLSAKLADAVRERDEAVAHALDQGRQEGSSAQSILELRGRDTFIAERRAELKAVTAERDAALAEVERLREELGQPCPEFAKDAESGKVAIVGEWPRLVRVTGELMRQLLDEKNELVTLRGELKEARGDALKAIQAATALRREIAGRWRPIAEAPRDGVILAFRKGARTNAVVLVFWSEKTESWMSAWNGARLTPQPTLWQPITLPQPPEGAA